MFHVVMSLLSSFRIGVRIKQVFERVIQKTVVTPWPWYGRGICARCGLSHTHLTEIESAGDLSPLVHPTMGGVDLSPVGSAKQRKGARSPRSSAALIPLRIWSAGEGRGREIAKAAVGSDGIVVDQPEGQGLTGLTERGEQGLVQQFIAEPAVKALDEGVLLGLPGAM